MDIGLIFKKLEGALEKGQRHEDAPPDVSAKAAMQVIAFWLVFALQVWLVLRLVIWLCGGFR